jgi:hypothetical protein
MAPKQQQSFEASTRDPARPVIVQAPDEALTPITASVNDTTATTIDTRTTRPSSRGQIALQVGSQTTASENGHATSSNASPPRDQGADSEADHTIAQSVGDAQSRDLDLVSNATVGLHAGHPRLQSTVTAKDLTATPNADRIWHRIWHRKRAPANNSTDAADLVQPSEQVPDGALARLLTVLGPERYQYQDPVRVDTPALHNSRIPTAVTGQTQATATVQATASPARKHFTNALHEFVPPNSPLMESIDRRKTRAWIKERDSWDSTAIDLATVTTHLKDLRTSQPLSDCSVLIVEDIKPDLAELLLSEFPETVNQQFFMNNMVRFDSCSVTDESVERLRHTMWARRHGPQLESDPADGNVKLFNIPPISPYLNGFHLDYNIRPTISYKSLSTFRTLEGLRPDHFEKNLSDFWRRTSTRLSVCQLENQLCKNRLEFIGREGYC